MKLYLASFLEVHNFGPGRVIGIANGNKPDHVECSLVFTPLIPTQQLSQTYNKMSLKDPEGASKHFVTEFQKQLDEFYSEVVNSSEEENVTPQEILPFEDGDSICSWERAAYTNYRRLIAPYLEKLGYEVSNN